ncbi:hypothetical protein ScPMuIL_000119 [Solemya velum]
MLTMLALMIWIHDVPVTGNIIKLSMIVDPRKPFEEYKVGDLVKARCIGFGVVEGMIGKLVDESQKKELEDILRGVKFTELVEEMGLNVTQKLKVTARQDSVLPPQKIAKTIATQVKTNLQKAAAELELTELADFMQMGDSGASENSNEVSATSIVKASLDVLNFEEPPQKEFENTTAAKVENLERQVEQLKQEVVHANGRLQQVESNLSWLWSHVQQMQLTTTQAVATVTNTTGSNRNTCTSTDSAVAPSTSFHANQFEEKAQNENEETEFVGGYSIMQLEDTISEVASFSKASILLFRMLFKEEEYKGKSLCGLVKGGAERRESVDQNKLNGIYRVIKKKYPHVTPVMVREKLRDILKPSRYQDNTGRPLIGSNHCYVAIGSMGVKFHGSFSWIYNLFKSRAYKALKKSVVKKLCEVIANVINNDAKEFLKKLKVTTLLDEEFYLDYRLTATPNFSNTYMETMHKGEIFWNQNKKEAPFSAAPLPPVPRSDKMVYLWVSDFLFNTAMLVAQKNKFLTFNLTANDLPAGYRGFLDTNCTMMCVGAMVPMIRQKYPGTSVELEMTSSKEPHLDVQNGQLIIRFVGDIKMNALMKNQNPAYLLTISSTMNITVNISIDNEQIIGHLHEKEIDVDLKDSVIGIVDRLALQLMTNSAMFFFVEPQINSEYCTGTDDEIESFRNFVL